MKTKTIAVMLLLANGPQLAAKSPLTLVVAPIPLVAMIIPGIPALISPIIMVPQFMQQPPAMCSSPAGTAAMVAIFASAMILAWKLLMDI